MEKEVGIVGVMADNQKYGDRAFFNQNDSYKYILKFGTHFTRRTV
jgi:hypothetical protein